MTDYTGIHASAFHTRCEYLPKLDPRTPCQRVIHDLCEHAFEIYRILGKVEVIVFDDGTSDEFKSDTLYELLYDSPADAPFAELWAAYEPTMTEEDFIHEETVEPTNYDDQEEVPF